MKGNVSHTKNTGYVKCKNKMKPPHNVSLHKRMWHTMNAEYEEIYIYSAIYDSRTAGGNNPFIRILAIGRTILRLFCHFWFPEGVISVKAKIAVNGAGRRIDGDLFKQYYFSCQLPPGFLFIPTHVSLTSLQCGGNFHNRIPITIPENPQKMHEFGICVPITYWYVDPYRIVEWIEMNKLFGVTEINVYTCNLSEITMNVLRYFQDEGILKVHDIPPPKNGHTKDEVNVASAISINDCMWKNMYRYKYVLIIDFDEIIVPKFHSNYTDLLQWIDEENDSVNHKAYTFRNTYFWVGCKATMKRISSYISMFTQREDPSYYGLSAKTFLDPTKCLSAFNHMCLTEFLSLKNVSPRKYIEVMFITLILLNRRIELFHFGLNRTGTKIKS